MKERRDLYSLIVWYLFFGAIHELTHIVVALVTDQADGMLEKNDDIGFLHFLLRALLLRQCHFPGLKDGLSGVLVRHSAWIMNVLMFVLVKSIKRDCSTKSALLLPSFITALEAVSTDLFGVLAPSFSSNDYYSSKLLFCGNFGVILLHDGWSRQNGRSALDILETMVQVTMMRGAQSGGTITFRPRGNDGDGGVKGVRSRVVNKKRTDLSKLVRRRVERDVRFPVEFICGHTRFATSSKATFEGTHPHRWTPPTEHRIYNTSNRDSFSYDSIGSRRVKKPTTMLVENYITHNGDFDYYSLNGMTYTLHNVQTFLISTLGPMPSPVDSNGIAGMIDILRTRGSFALSTRYALYLGLKTSLLAPDPNFPKWKHFDAFGQFCEHVFEDMLSSYIGYREIEDDVNLRAELSNSISSSLVGRAELALLVEPFELFLTDDEGEASLSLFCKLIVDAFFDNDLFFATQTFMKNAKGSFGLVVTSSLDAERQFVIAARGQTMSVAFYPSKGLVCFGSEQAAVKVGLNYPFARGDRADSSALSNGTNRTVDSDVFRFDLDDLNGEVVLLDWGRRGRPVSTPNQHLAQHKMMKDTLQMVIYHETKATKIEPKIYHRMTKLTDNEMVLPLPEECTDPVLSDIQDIPRVCRSIQDEWSSTRAGSSLNRLTAFHLSRCLRRRLEKRVKGNVHQQAVDILLTGCEVSLWLAEQFASDLKKAFPLLRIEAVSSNKLLGLYGQDISVPSLGFPGAQQTHQLEDAIIIIVSHSGGTFAPLSCSNLLQSKTRNLFVVTSEWDTQISKQLRAMDAMKDNFLSSRIFTTNVGIRPAEPCSVSVVATHQLLTNLFLYISAVILSDREFRICTAATISEQDLMILEKCNRFNLDALSEIVSSDDIGEPFDEDEITKTTKLLKRVGNLWANHVLEVARGYILTFLYVVGTVVSGYPLLHGIAVASGVEFPDWQIYLYRLLDGLIYFWMPQICIALIRLVQGRNMRHRMVARTVVIGDIPWVAQAADAFLSKLFACSYSIAGIHVLSGNPADHFLHRHTHRIVRGTLVVFGRPDGRLSALSTTEAAVCLAVNQASSIQSWGGTCESITIGHNPVKLDLTKNAIFLKRKRPLFLCERMLAENDVKDDNNEAAREHASEHEEKDLGNMAYVVASWFKKWFGRPNIQEFLDTSGHTNSSIIPRVHHRRSAAALIGEYTSFEETTAKKYLAKKKVAVETVNCDEDAMTVDAIVVEAIEERKFTDEARNLFRAVDTDGDGFISFDEFMKSPFRESSNSSEDELRSYYEFADQDGTGRLDYREFLQLMKQFQGNPPRLPPSNRNEKGIIEINPSREKYFGETIRRYNAGKTSAKTTGTTNGPTTGGGAAAAAVAAADVVSDDDNVDFWLARRQHFSHELYETRIASMQRFVAMAVLFYQMGKRVQEFFPWISMGLWGYRMDRTHSILRIASTASPISGADVKRRIRKLQLATKVQRSIKTIETAYAAYRKRKTIMERKD